MNYELISLLLPLFLCFSLYLSLSFSIFLYLENICVSYISPSLSRSLSTLKIFVYQIRVSDFIFALIKYFRITVLYKLVVICVLVLERYFKFYPTTDRKRMLSLFTI